MKRVYIGTSGWSYKSWDKTFYPPDVPKKRQFEFYATQFCTVEINNTFYRLPNEKMVEGWRDKAPKGFVYAVKGSRFITHMKKLANLDGALEKFFERMSALKKRTGVILWQLPRMLRKDAARLEEFLCQLPKDYRYAVEFRHPSWLEPAIYELLGRYDAGYVSVSSLGMPMDLTVTSDLVYIRFHGLELGAAHDYTRKELEPWATHIREQAQAGRTVYVYFNNDANVRAPANAKLLMAMVHNRSTTESRERVLKRRGPALLAST
ncbi:MAG TPA: DUF72 domain-containing protein [Candidatus Dormibacteraeota bacterium]|nr:DUF72 domain-containing protein [Candidatus Dormibacteraeota bacterium]